MSHEFAEARLEGMLRPREVHNTLDAWELQTSVDTQAVVAMAQASMRERSDGLSDLCLAVLKLSPDAAPVTADNRQALLDATLVSSAPAKLSHMVHTSAKLDALDVSPLVRYRPPSPDAVTAADTPPPKKGLFFCCGSRADVARDSGASPEVFNTAAPEPPRQARYLVVPMGKHRA